MSLKNALNARFNDEFINANVKGADPLAPRNGYYFIKEVDYKDIRDKGSFPIATVLWKTDKDQSFVKDVTFDISLSSLNIGEPLDYMNMVNKTIFIFDVQVVRINDYSDKTRISCKYEVVSESPVFTTLQSLVFTSFVGDSSTLNEAYNKFEKNLGIDLTHSIDSEASQGDAPDAPEDDK